MAGLKDEKKWDVLDYWWQSQLKKPVVRTNAPAQLEECLAFLYDQRNAVWTGMAAPPDGMKLVVFPVRSKMEVYIRFESRARRAAFAAAIGRSRVQYATHPAAATNSPPAE